MKVLLRTGLVVLLTPLVFIGLSRIDPLARWVGSNAVWTALTPVFHLFGVSGSEGEENVLLGALLVMSFVVATIIVWLASVLIRRQRGQQAER
ncbi:hypothetical protein R69619_03716 [Paraburkholderia nemoris]|uniref:hypothetical protein n=1 Tax=Paraburkholderia nemoris TaxID=2793076 RepID=UPI00190CD3B2|nr:hypothetical protein [Paraburkholderia nemoris]MBK3744193.1 hypothetical protein [Paraburkholderia aspalathi]CAE6768204.1 hypothetical protein R69619_03716 [Paraburkholderia nemoris]